MIWQDLYLGSLRALGVDLRKERFDL